MDLPTPGHVHHVCPDCGHVTDFSFGAVLSIAPSWTCKCGYRVQLPRVPANVSWDAENHARDLEIEHHDGSWRDRD